MHYRLSRLIYLAADKSLNNSNPHAWRLLETSTFPNPAVLTIIHTPLYPTSACCLRARHDTLSHII